MNKVTLLIVIISIFSCKKDYKELKQFAENKKINNVNNKATTVTPFYLGDWFLDLEQSTIHKNLNVEIFDYYINLQVVSQNEIIINPKNDTLYFVNDTLLKNRNWIKRQEIKYENKVFKYQEFIPDPATQMTYLVELIYVR